MTAPEFSRFSGGGLGAPGDPCELSCDRVGSASAIALAGVAALPDMSPRALGQMVEWFGPEGVWPALWRNSDVSLVAPRPDDRLGPSGRRRSSPEVPLPFGASTVLSDPHDPSPPASGGSGPVDDRIRRHWHRWSMAIRSIDLGAVSRRLHDLDAWVAHVGERTFPERLRSDPFPPAIVFGRGDVRSLQRPAVAIVGTRRSTRYGRTVATELAQHLADRGVLVISGLARGIDGAAHRGALVGEHRCTAAIIGCGIDRAYPSEHRSLQDEIASCGLVLTESPLAAAPVAWRFPARNRLIAALSDVIVVVESCVSGGSLLTVHEAVERSRVVMAVPGTINSVASAGTNRLIADGAIPMLTYDDVVMALGTSLFQPNRSAGAALGASACSCTIAEDGANVEALTALDHVAPTVTAADSLHPDPGRLLPDNAKDPSVASFGSGAVAVDRRVLGALNEQPASLDDVARHTDLPLLGIISSLERLQRDGLAVQSRGWWMKS